MTQMLIGATWIVDILGYETTLIDLKRAARESGCTKMALVTVVPRSYENYLPSLGDIFKYVAVRIGSGNYEVMVANGDQFKLGETVGLLYAVRSLSA